MSLLFFFGGEIIGNAIPEPFDALVTDLNIEITDDNGTVIVAE